MSLIESKAKSIMTDAIKKIATEYETTNTDVQIQMRFDNGEPKFFAMQGYKPKREITINELYPVLIDLFNVKQVLPVFVANLIIDTATDKGLDVDDVWMLISTNVESVDKLYVHAYNFDRDSNIIKPIEQLPWSEVFGQEAMMKLMAKQG